MFTLLATVSLFTGNFVQTTYFLYNITQFTTSFSFLGGRGSWEETSVESFDSFITKFKPIKQSLFFFLITVAHH
jgi:hypothetical protein